MYSPVVFALAFCPARGHLGAAVNQPNNWAMKCQFPNSFRSPLQVAHLEEGVWSDFKYSLSNERVYSASASFEHWDIIHAREMSESQWSLRPPPMSECAPENHT